jgi:methylglutaconyl-CoA hydratase
LEFSATQAHAAGLVHQVQEPAQIDLAVHAVLSQVRRNSPMAMQVAKRLNQELSPFQPISYREKVCQTIAETRVSSEGQEGLSAFLQKRKPSWSGGA